MKNFITLLLLFLLNLNFSFAQEDEPNFIFYDSSEEIIPLKKSSQTIGKCCQLGKAMSKLSGGMSDVYLVQSELNKDGTYTVFFVSMFSIGFDTELTQFGVENPTAKISSFHLASEDKFNLLRNLMIKGYKEFKAHPIIKKIKYADISQVLEGGQNEGDKLLLRFHNKKIVKYVSFQLFDKDTGNKTSGRPIFSKFIGQLFGSDEIIDTN
ncbi:MAG: hypothetical protein CMC67_06965 [Flavobacteriaceae bacterium]|nr:hypothetical protein [Flavobacteriaceae bacterium]|tara:strand:+ start:287 stop:916 length:630 start_codon:yes stop_codon:yes gene_type:complete